MTHENWWHFIIASDCAGWERSIQVQRFDLFLSHTWLTNGRPGPFWGTFFGPGVYTSMLGLQYATMLLGLRECSYFFQKKMALYGTVPPAMKTWGWVMVHLGMKKGTMVFIHGWLVVWNMFFPSYAGDDPSH